MLQEERIPIDDAALVAEVQKCGPEAFAPIIERYKEAVFAVALARLRRFHDAEDVAQATFVEAFERLKNLKDPARLGAWLRSIALHRSIDLLRRESRHVELGELDEPRDRGPGPLGELEATELREQVLQAVGCLPRTQRETVTLYYIGGYSQEEVAAMLEVPLGTVKRRLHEARKRLKEDMLGMVEEVLKEEAPKEAFAERVFNLLNRYPQGKISWAGWQAVEEELRKIAVPGVEGFIKALEMPHWQTRRMATEMMEYALPDHIETVIELMKKSLSDPNRRVRRMAALSLMEVDVSFERKRDEFLPLVAPLLLDRSMRTRRRIALLLQGGWGEDDMSAHVPLEIVAEAHLRETNELAQRWLGTLLEKRLQANNPRLT